MHRFVSTLQVVAGKLAEGAPANELLDVLDRVPATVPNAASRAEQLAVTTLLRQLRDRVSSALLLPPGTLDDEVTTGEELARVLSQVRAHHVRPTPIRLKQFEARLRRDYPQSGLKERDVADAVGVSPSHLSRLLMSHTGHGFSWHLRTVRVEHAKLLLLSSTLTMKELAAALGFTRPSEFTRQFKEATGATPSAYRARAGNM